MDTDLISIANSFQIEGEIDQVKVLGEGYVNDTYIVTTKGNSPSYIMQRKNRRIFSSIPSMMENIRKVCLHMKKKVEIAGGDPLREAMTVIPSNDGKLYFLDDEKEYWSVTLFIEDTITYESVDTAELAYAGGKGIGRFQSMLADLHEPLVDILPGFHDIRYRYKQWDEVLAKDPVGRKSGILKEVEWIESRRREMLDFWQLVENNTIPRRVTHNDTKINNILFNKDGEVLCLIDLDTVLNSTVLNDFGDAMRSYTNTGLDDDEDLDNVSMDIEIYKAFTRGYLEETHSFLSREELEYLAFSAKYITYEQVLRFLMDYIDGDKYYKTKYPEHNLVFASAQYKLLLSMEEKYEEMKEIVQWATLNINDQ
ncbi:MAG: aminoglycoside phosphotransferase family protein [Bacteroidota bacterium]